jgi:hypothetical protein
MSIVQTQTTSFKAQLYQGIHDLTTDVIKIALYTASADLNEDTTVYSSTNEVVATGTYSAWWGAVNTPITVASLLATQPMWAFQTSLGQAQSQQDVL